MQKAAVAPLVLVILAALFTANTPLIGAESENSWTAKAPMPTPRAGFGMAVVNGKIYAMGGYDKSQTYFLTVNEEYDPATNTWTDKAPMLTARVSFATAVFDNKIYTFGGQVLDEDGNRIVINTTEVYDPATDTWTAKAALPKPAEDFGAAVVEGKIYVIGTDTDVYDPVTDTWASGAPIPKAIAHSAYAVLDNKIYVISGNYHGDNPDFYEPIDLNQIYDSQTDTWRQGAPIPTSVASAAAVATTGVDAPKAIYVVGGLVVTVNATGGYVFNPQDLVQVYFPENDSWREGAPMPTARYALSVAALDDAVYALGGSNSIVPPDSTDNEQYAPFGYEAPATQAVPLDLVLGIVALVIATMAVAVLYALRKRHI